MPRAEARSQTPPALEAARDFIQEALVQRAINEQADRWLKKAGRGFGGEFVEREQAMTKESRWRKILWLEHAYVLWVLGTWSLLGIALAIIAVGSGLANPLLRRVLIHRMETLTGTPRRNSHSLRGLVFAECHGEWIGGAWQRAGGHRAVVERGTGPRGTAH